MRMPQGDARKAQQQELRQSPDHHHQPQQDHQLLRQFRPERQQQQPSRQKEQEPSAEQSDKDQAKGAPKPRAKRTSFPTSVVPGSVPPERRKTCDVCGDDSDRHHLNYGANVCFSCRAFFRRAHQQSAHPKFACKWEGNCTITVKNRRRCQKCRYDACRAVGMRSECVLDLGQRRHRFRKALEKRSPRLAAALLPEAGGDADSRGEGSSTAAAEMTPSEGTVSPAPSATSTGDELQQQLAAEAADGKRSAESPISSLPPIKRMKMRYCMTEQLRGASAEPEEKPREEEKSCTKPGMADKSTSTEGLLWLGDLLGMPVEQALLTLMKPSLLEAAKASSFGRERLGSTASLTSSSSSEPPLSATSGEASS